MREETTTERLDREYAEITGGPQVENYGLVYDAATGKWDESKHPRASDGRFGTKAGESGGTDAPARDEFDEPAELVNELGLNEEQMAKAAEREPGDVDIASDPQTPPPPGGYDVDPTPPQGGVAPHARVGVPGNHVPPPPPIPQLPNLTPNERTVEKSFSDAYQADPDGMAGQMIAKMQAGEIGDAPNIFATDEAKKLHADWSCPGCSDEDRNYNRALYNTALHQTANAVAKRAFVKYLDEVVAKLPPERRYVMTTNGGVAAGKGFALASNPEVLNLSRNAGAVWDAAGEQNSTELPWIQAECEARGIATHHVFVHADPSKTWTLPKRGVVERAGRVGRMVDARPFADSYSHGVQNFNNFMQKSGGKASFHIFDNRPLAEFDKSLKSNDNPEGIVPGTGPVKIGQIPPEALQVDSEQLYQQSVAHLQASPAPAHVKAGGLAGLRIWR